MASPKSTIPEEDRKLTRKTIQIIGFTFATVLTVVKLSRVELDIPWWVVFGFFGAGASGVLDFTSIFDRRSR